MEKEVCSPREQRCIFRGWENVEEPGKERLRRTKKSPHLSIQERREVQEEDEAARSLEHSERPGNRGRGLSLGCRAFAVEPKSP